MEEDNFFLSIVIHLERYSIHWIVWKTETVVNEEEAARAPPVVIGHLLSLLKWLACHYLEDMVIVRHVEEALFVNLIEFLLTYESRQVFFHLTVRSAQVHF